MLYESLRTKLLPLDDDLIVYPAHGAGSACGKNMSKKPLVPWEQKKTNYALNPELSKNDFVDELIHGLLPPPGYFGMNVSLNKSGYENITKVIDRGLTPLNVEKFKELSAQDDILILDTRKAAEFSRTYSWKFIRWTRRAVRSLGWCCNSQY